MATAFELQGSDRRVVAVVGDGALTGGMAYEALNNLGHSGKRVVIVLNDNGRSYAPTVSQLSLSLTHLRLSPSYVQARQRLRQLLRELPGVGELAYSGIHGLTSALREVVTPHTFFEALGHPLRRPHRRPRHRRRRAGPGQRRRVGRARSSSTSSPRRAGATRPPRRTTSSASTTSRCRRPRVPALDGPDAPVVVPPPRCCRTPRCRSAGPTSPRTSRSPPTPTPSPGPCSSTPRPTPGSWPSPRPCPGPTGLLPFEARFPDRFVDVGIAEQHAVTAAAGMAMAGLRPVVAVYSTFFSRAFDQANLDVGLHKVPVVLVLDRAGITGDDGPSHHGVLDLALSLSIPGMTVFAPSSAPEVEVMLATALTLDGPVGHPLPEDAGAAGRARRRGLRASRPGWSGEGDGSVCILAVGKMLGAAEAAAARLAAEGIDATVWDLRVVSHPDPAMLADAGRHALVVTVEDGVRQGGAGMFLGDALRASLPLGACPADRDPGRAPRVPRPGQARPDPGPARPRRGRRGPHRPREPGRAPAPGGAAQPGRAGPAGRPLGHRPPRLTPVLSPGRGP